jgi:hypothetical protein
MFFELAKTLSRIQEVSLSTPELQRRRKKVESGFNNRRPAQCIEPQQAHFVRQFDGKK